ncbi:MAG: hypothetical protein ABFS10_05430 [Bacteroidota bacterium]
MEIRKFRTAYDLELIPASHEGIRPGDLVWDPLFGPPLFAKKGMPNTIYTAFLDAEMVTKDEWAALQEESRLTPLREAHLASRTVDVEVKFVSELQHPEIGKIQGEFFTEKVSKFTFGNLMMRGMDNLIRIRIDHHLEKMKAQKWREYDGRIRRVFMITELYYGTIKMVVEKQYSAELDSLLQHTELKAATKLEGAHAVEYEFSHDNVPFAMRIERIRTFNG